MRSSQLEWLVAAEPVVGIWPLMSADERSAKDAIPVGD